MDKDKALREHVANLLRGGQTYQPIAKLLRGLKAEEAGRNIEGLPYTIWQQLEHLRFALYDILDFSRNPDYEEPTWPDDYWPKEKAPADQAALDASLASISQGVEEMIALVEDTQQDLYAAFPHGNGQTLLREAMLVAEHNAYHVGQVMVMRRILGNWE
ncbi:DinB family protein [uncultured Pontibacter sp.]|uniref:DinB family protein n=1 Tax=uncultured Pontibacter sp. TaxID=453356 RepID=UPI002626A97E|nr:DinB family protein [uncultured Pontibacter sp.]